MDGTGDLIFVRMRGNPPLYPEGPANAAFHGCGILHPPLVVGEFTPA